MACGVVIPDNMMSEKKISLYDDDRHTISSHYYNILFHEIQSERNTRSNCRLYYLFRWFRHGSPFIKIILKAIGAILDDRQSCKKCWILGSGSGEKN